MPNVLAKTDSSSISTPMNVDVDRVEALGNPSVGVALLEHGADELPPGASSGSSNSGGETISTTSTT